jgi:hypothetical protein
MSFRRASEARQEESAVSRQPSNGVPMSRVFCETWDSTAIDPHTISISKPRTAHPTTLVIPTRERSKTGGIRCKPAALEWGAPCLASFARRGIPPPSTRIRFRFRSPEPPTPQPLSFRRASEARQEESAVRRPPRYFLLLRRTGFRNISQASRYFSYFDRFLLLPG